MAPEIVRKSAYGLMVDWLGAKLLHGLGFRGKLHNLLIVSIVVPSRGPLLGS